MSAEMSDGEREYLERKARAPHTIPESVHQAWRDEHEARKIDALIERQRNSEPPIAPRTSPAKQQRIEQARRAQEANQRAKEQLVIRSRWWALASLLLLALAGLLLWMRWPEATAAHISARTLINCLIAPVILVLLSIIALMISYWVAGRSKNLQ